MEQQPVWLIALIFVLFVLLPIGYIWSGIKLIHKNIRLAKNADLVVGKVVEIDQVPPHLQLTRAARLRLVFEFKNPQGEVLHGETVTASHQDNFALHSEHDILVDFNSPGTVYIPRDRSYLKATAMIVIAGVILFAGGNFMLSLN